MKKLNFLFILSILFTSLSLTAQYGYDDDFYDDDFYPGYLGDNFSLEGALETFKDSRSVDEFENRINGRDNFVNNLDLNNDGRTDFIRVSDESNDRNNRLLVMQAVLGRNDVQDIAVIAIEKTGRRRANLQIIGDEYLFGPDMVLEPNDIAYNQNRRGYGPSGDAVVTRGFVNVYYWPAVRNIFAPRYTYYRSPYYWGYYPRVWNPWRPFYYNTYYDRTSRYRRGYFRPAPSVTIVYVNNYYRPNRRSYSPWVRDRYNRCEVVYNRDRNRNGNRRRTISQTPPERRRDFDRKRGIREDKRLGGGIAGTNTGRNSNRNERGRDNVTTKVERGGYIGKKAGASKSTNRGEFGSAPSRNDKEVSRSKKSYGSVDRGSYKDDRRSSSTKPSRGNTYGSDRKTSSERSSKGSSSYKNDRKSSTKPNRSSDYKSDRSSSTKPSRGSYKSDRRSSTVKPNRSTSKKSDRSSSYKSDRKSTSMPSRGSSSYKSDRRSSSVKSSRGSSSSRKSSSVKSAPKRSTSKASRKSSKPSKSYKSNSGSSSKKSNSSKSAKRGKGF